MSNSAPASFWQLRAPKVFRLLLGRIEGLAESLPVINKYTYERDTMTSRGSTSLGQSLTSRLHVYLPRGT